MFSYIQTEILPWANLFLYIYLFIYILNFGILRSKFYIPHFLIVHYNVCNKKNTSGSGYNSQLGVACILSKYSLRVEDIDKEIYEKWYRQNLKVENTIPSMILKSSSLVLCFRTETVSWQN